MCTETKQFYACGCVTTLHDICAGHIAHTHRQTDNNPCPKHKEKSIMGPLRCRGVCVQRKDNFYTFETQGETLVERTKHVNEEWEAERKQREAERLKKEAAVAAYGKDDGEMEKGMVELSEGDGRAGKRAKREESAFEMDIEEYEDEGGEVQMEDEGFAETASDNSGNVN